MSVKDSPLVSIVMAVYNGETYLRETILSILNQTFRNFECIIINDGSTDSTEDILTGLTDPRILILQNKENQGLPYSLNRGFSIAQGAYIARIDAGDFAVPERLEKQVTFLETHPNVGIVGSGCIVVNDSGEKLGEAHFPLSDLHIRWMSLLDNPFLHPSVMLCREVLCRHNLSYDTSFQATQDYDLWTRMLSHTHGANLQELLILYRESRASITSQSRELQLQNHDRVALRTIHQQLPDFEILPEQVTQLREAFCGGNIPEHKRDGPRAKLAGAYLDLLTAFTGKYHEYPEIQAFQRRETLNIAKMVCHLRFWPYWISTFTRSVRLYPWIAYPLTRYLFRKYVWKKMRRALRRS